MHAHTEGIDTDGEAGLEDELPKALVENTVNRYVVSQRSESVDAVVPEPDKSATAGKVTLTLSEVESRSPLLNWTRTLSRLDPPT